MKHKLIKLISITITIALLWQDVMWAHPGEFHVLRPVALEERISGPAVLHDKEVSELAHLPIPKMIVKMLCATMLDQIFFTALFVAEMAIVGRLNVGAMACLNIGRTVSQFAFVPIGGIVATIKSLVSHGRGAKDKDRTTQAAFNALWLGAAVSVVCAVLLAIFAPWILSLFGLEAQTLSLGVSYLRVFSLTAMGMSMVWILRSLFYSAGETFKSVYVAAATFATTFTLLLILPSGWGPVHAMGLIGVGWAQALGRLAGVLMGLYFIVLKPSGFIKLTANSIKPRLSVIKEIFKLGVYQFAQGSVEASYGMFVLMIVGYFGVTAIAATGVIGTFAWILAIPLIGLGTVCATLVGINLGARNIARAEEAVRTCSSYGRVIAWSLAAVIFIFASDAIRFFNADPEVLRIGVPLLRITTLTYSANMLSRILQDALFSARDTKTPFIRTSIVNAGIGVSLALAYFVFHAPLIVLWIIMGLGSFAGVWFLKWRFHKGLWKQLPPAPAAKDKKIPLTVAQTPAAPQYFAPEAQAVTMPISNLVIPQTIENLLSDREEERRKMANVCWYMLETQRNSRIKKPRPLRVKPIKGEQGRYCVTNIKDARILKISRILGLNSVPVIIRDFESMSHGGTVAAGEKRVGLTSDTEGSYEDVGIIANSPEAVFGNIMKRFSEILHDQEELNALIGLDMAIMKTKAEANIESIIKLLNWLTNEFQNGIYLRNAQRAKIINDLLTRMDKAYFSKAVKRRMSYIGLDEKTDNLRKAATVLKGLVQGQIAKSLTPSPKLRHHQLEGILTELSI